MWVIKPLMIGMITAIVAIITDTQNWWPAWMLLAAALPLVDLTELADNIINKLARIDLDDFLDDLDFDD